MTVDLRNDDALLSEALAPHSDGPTDRPGCYALSIATPEGGHETHARRWHAAGYDTLPAYLGAIAAAEEVLYVGRAASVRDRIAEHLSGDVRTATLPSVYEVRSIVGVRWGANTDHAEQTFADDLRAELGTNAFIHTR